MFYRYLSFLSLVFLLLNASAVFASEVYQGSLTERRNCSLDPRGKLRCQKLVLPQDRRCVLHVHGQFGKPGVGVNAGLMGIAQTRDAGDIYMGLMSRMETRGQWAIFNSFEGDKRSLVVKVQNNKPIGFEMRLDNSVSTSTFETTGFKGLQCINLKRIR